MIAGLPPTSTRISTAPGIAGFSVEGSRAARMEFLASMPLILCEGWVLRAPKALLCIPMVSGVALRGEERDISLIMSWTPQCCELLT